MRFLSLVCTAVMAALFGCQQAPEPPVFSPRFAPVPSLGDSTGPRLAAGPTGELILSWMEPGDDGTALRFAVYEDGTWGTPYSVVENAPLFVNWADLPSVVPMGDGRLAAHWLQTGDHSHAYNVVFAESLDAGATWSSPVVPHRDGTDTEHGFVSMYAADHATGLLWLDGRKMVNDVTDDPVVTGMTLRAAVITNDAIDNEQLVDELICDCCQTDIAVTDSGPVAVYRDRSVNEIRDIAVTRHLDGRWQTGVRVARDDWEIAGCPVNGPSISAAGSRVAVAWFTAAIEPLVRLSISADSGAHFAAPVDIVRSDTLGRVGVVLLGDGDVAVSWLQASDAGAVIKVRRVSADGTLGPTRTISDSPAVFSVPQMALSGDDLVFAWTESGGSSDRVVSARVGARSL
ncbi:MAG: sialidase family protein [Gammaproteobacteria bacterium]